MKATLLHHCYDQTGEAATWLPDRRMFLWVDIDNGILHTYHPESGVLTEFPFPEMVTAIIPWEGKSEEVILVLKNRLVSYHLADKTYTTLAEMPPLHPQLRTNDCKASPEGRIWLGVMHLTDYNESGFLYCMNNDLSLTLVLTRQCIPNGLVWNGAGDKMYFVDSGKGCIDEYAYDRLTGNIDFVRIAVRVPPEYGVPDGMTIDANGLLWVAHWGGFGVYVWNPEDGTLMDKVEVPVPNVASCTFGGVDNHLLFITTALAGLDNVTKETYPLSGSLFVVEVPDIVRGENHYPFKLVKT